MSLKNHYYYDEGSCEFLPVKYDPIEQFVYNAAVWILTGVVLSSVGIILLSSYVGTPSEIALKAENEILVDQLQANKDALAILDERMNNISQQDNELYRSVLGMDEISYEERQAGIGGSEPPLGFDIYNTDTEDLLRWTSSKIENLERKIGIQQLSFEQIKAAYNVNKDRLAHIPSIKPTAGILLSSFGDRIHPILKFKRPHNGLDFRAPTGSKIYATGNGTISYTGLNGNLGRVVIIDHGYGYKTKYAHLSTIPKEIKKGVKVERGQLIAFSGESGLADGPHLHYEVIFNGKHLDPFNYLFTDLSPEEYQLFKKIAAENKVSRD